MERSIFFILTIVVIVNGQSLPRCVFRDAGGSRHVLDLRALADVILIKSDVLTPPNLYEYSPCENGIDLDICAPDTAMAVKLQGEPPNYEKCDVIANWDTDAQSTMPYYNAVYERWTFNYSTGNDCNNEPYKFFVYYKCDHNIADFRVVSVGSLHDCESEMYIDTQWACPGEVYTTTLTTVSIDGTNFKINGAITYSSSSNSNVKGLMFNSRMVQGIFDDYNQSTVHRWAYPDTKKWDPDRNVKEFVGNMSLWHQNKLLSFTVGLQGGCPYGYCSSQPWIVSAYDFKTGALDTKYFNRLNQILSKADSLGMVPIVQLFYFGQVGRFNHNNNAIYAAINNTMQWLLTSKYRGILIEVVNEVNEGYGNTILDTANIAKTISYVKQITNNIFPVGTSYGGGGIPSDAVVEASDVIFLHGNGQSPGGITNMINKVHSMQSYKNKPKPIVFNEDDHYNFNSSSNNMKSAVDGHASWGYFDGCSSNTADDYHDGYQCPATSWAIDTNRKAGFFEKVDYYATT